MLSLQNKWVRVGLAAIGVGIAGWAGCPENPNRDPNRLDNLVERGVKLPQSFTTSLVPLRHKNTAVKVLVSQDEVGISRESDQRLATEQDRVVALAVAVAKSPDMEKFFPASGGDVQFILTSDTRRIAPLFKQKLQGVTRTLHPCNGSYAIITSVEMFSTSTAVVIPVGNSGPAGVLVDDLHRVLIDRLMAGSRPKLEGAAANEFRLQQRASLAATVTLLAKEADSVGDKDTAAETFREIARTLPH